MSDDKAEIKKEILALEREMGEVGFWDDKARAQEKVRELQELKDKLAGIAKYDRRDAVISIISGAGGDDAEDFARMLFGMYQRFIERAGWQAVILHEHRSDLGGIKNISLEVKGKNVYGILKNETGVHRLVRISPFKAKSQRHTSFALVEVVPRFEREDEKNLVIPEKDLKIEFMRAGGPGGQNVNKRETAVRIVHIPTNLSAHVSAERSQERNRETAMDLLRAKLYKKLKEAEEAEEGRFGVGKTTEIEWGNQIRSYVLHPYKMVKDHRTGVETSDVDSVLVGGKIDSFIEAERGL